MNKPRVVHPHRAGSILYVEVPSHSKDNAGYQAANRFRSRTMHASYIPTMFVQTAGA